MDEGWYVGRLREVPGVFSQGESLEELEENIRDVYRLMIEEEGVWHCRRLPSWLRNWELRRETA